MRKRYIKVTEGNKQFVISFFEKMGGIPLGYSNIDMSNMIGDYIWLDNNNYIVRSNFPPPGYTEIFLDANGNEIIQESIKDKYRSEIIEPALKESMPAESEDGKSANFHKVDDKYNKFLFKWAAINNVSFDKTQEHVANTAALEYLSEIRREKQKLRACLRFFYDNFQALAEHGRSINNNGDIREMEIKAKELLK